MILECLRHWTVHYRVDGFRFDLASILGRDEDGMPMNNPPLLRSLAYDPLLRNVKLIAEAWDAGGLYQVGNFPASKRWAEWNGQYRDTMRGYLKGDFWEANSAAWRICGSGDLYGGYYSEGNNNYAGYNPASTSLLVMMDLRYMIYILITINIMKQMAGTTQTERTITEAGTAVWKEIRMIQSTKTKISNDPKCLCHLNVQPWNTNVLLRRRIWKYEVWKQ